MTRVETRITVSFMSSFTTQMLFPVFTASSLPTMWTLSVLLSTCILCPHICTHCGLGSTEEGNCVFGFVCFFFFFEATGEYLVFSSVAFAPSYAQLCNIN